MNKNNQSRTECGNFCKMYNFEKLNQSNSIIDNRTGIEYSFCSIPDIDNISCRQFSEYSNGIIFSLDEKYYKIDKKYLKIRKNPSRISANMVKYFGTSAEFENADEIV